MLTEAAISVVDDDWTDSFPLSFVYSGKNADTLFTKHYPVN